ncbi:hypothetical protein PUR26_00335 [Streptomyces sp. SP18CS02]|nr:hypothetical protein [Streptomyces sp. SP18CS02]MEE1750993.1 hypothetical protein [Streptomyces sp. SP18CS02]
MPASARVRGPPHQRGRGLIEAELVVQLSGYQFGDGHLDAVGVAQAEGLVQPGEVPGVQKIEAAVGHDLAGGGGGGGGGGDGRGQGVGRQSSGGERRDRGHRRLVACSARVPGTGLTLSA